MAKIWEFISDPKTLAVLTLLGGAVAFVWPIVEKHVLSSAATQVASTAAASPTDVRFEMKSLQSGASTSLSPYAPAQSQRAEAGHGGNAIITGDHATITISDKKP